MFEVLEMDSQDIPEQCQTGSGAYWESTSRTGSSSKNLQDPPKPASRERKHMIFTPNRKVLS